MLKLMLARLGVACRLGAAPTPRPLYPHASLLERLALEPGPEVRLALALNPHTPPGILERLAATGDSRLHRALALHESTPLAVVDQLAAAHAAEVERRALGKEAEQLLEYESSAQILTRLAAAPVPVARQAVAINPRTPPAVLAHLADDADERVRWAVSLNEHAPLDLLEAIATAHQVRLTRLVTPAPDLAGLAAGAREDLALDAHTSPTVLVSLAADADPEVREAVALNPHAPAEALARLARDPDMSVRRAVALNPETTPLLLAEMVRDADSHVRVIAAQHPHVPHELAGQLAADPDPDVRLMIALNESVWPELLAQLAADPDAQVRQAAAFNPNTELEVLGRLAGDADPSVSTVAAGFIERMHEWVEFGWAPHPE